jgi:hypothetical protein
MPLPTTIKTFEQVRTELVEAGVRRLYESYVGREILIISAYVYGESRNDYQYFDPPLRAKVLPKTGGFRVDLTRWADKDHLDPLWPVEVLDSAGQLWPGTTVHEVDGLGWGRGVGFEKSTGAWSLAPASTTPKRQVLCQLNGAQTALFTDGRIYDIIRTEGTGMVIIDDRGSERFISVDRPSPHLNRYWKSEHYPYNHQQPVGVFKMVRA